MRCCDLGIWCFCSAQKMTGDQMCRFFGQSCSPQTVLCGWHPVWWCYWKREISLRIFYWCLYFLPSVAQSALSCALLFTICICGWLVVQEVSNSGLYSSAVYTLSSAFIDNLVALRRNRLMLFTASLNFTLLTNKHDGAVLYLRWDFRTVWHSFIHFPPFCWIIILTHGWSKNWEGLCDWLSQCFVLIPPVMFTGNQGFCPLQNLQLRPILFFQSPSIPGVLAAWRSPTSHWGVANYSS